MPDQPLPRHTRGSRPQFFADPGVDQMMSIVLGIAQELSVLRDRVDSVERLLDTKGSLTRAELEAFRPDPDAEAERQQRRADYLQRIFRAVRHEAGQYTSEDAEQHTAEVERALQHPARA
jgi:hypothetical protein